MMALLDEIKEKCSAELIASRDHSAIVAQVNLSRTTASGREIGIGTIIETIGLDAGNSFLDVVLSSDSSSPFRHIKKLVEDGRLIISSPLVKAAVQSMVPGVIKQEESDALLALAFVPDPITEHDVVVAMYSVDGTFLG